MKIAFPPWLIDLARMVLRSYHASMDEIIRQGDKEVRVFVTPEGVTGTVATSIPMKAIDGLAAKLEKRIEARRAKSADVAAHPATILGST